jgi:hypothetical protein
MEQGLSLASPAIQIEARAMFLQLRNMTSHSAPSFDLSQIIGMPPAGVIAAIPLEPATRIIGMNPSFLSPDFERLRCVYPEKIQRCPRPIRRKLRAREPTRWEFLATIGHVFSTEHAKRQHLLGR